ncbi:MAG: pilin [Leucothrix sp.]
MLLAHLLFRLSLCFFFSCSLAYAEAEQTAAGTAVETTDKPNTRSITQATEDKLVVPAYLHKRLPEIAIAYVRVPNVWSMLGVPSGNVLDPAVGSKAFTEATNLIKQGFSTKLIPEFPKESQLLLQLLLQHINSPLEATALKSTNPALPVTDLLITAGVGFETSAAVQAFLDKLAASPFIKISKPLDEDGQAELMITNQAGQVFWDKQLARLFIFISVNPNAGSITDLVGQLALNDSHPMLAAEQSIDTSGQGLFAWVNPPEAYTIAKKMGMPKKELTPLAMMGVATMKSVALGTGTQNGINRLKVAVDMPVMGLRAFIPTIKSGPTFDLKGKTNLVAVLGLPAKSHILAYETMASVGSSEEMKGYRDFKEGFAKNMGFNVEDIFDFFGQDISIVSGETGTYLAVRLNNEDAFKTALEKAVKDFELPYEQRTVAGHLYHHLQLPNISMDNILQANLQQGFDKIAKRMLSVPTHLYWQQEGDYLLIANLPQILMDRHNVSPTMPANQWLEQQQRIGPDGSLLMVSAINEGVPESVYRMQLSMLSYFGDLTDSPVDLFALPTAREVKLPKQGSYGLKLTSSDTQLAVELTYENNPLELLGGSTYASTAIAGAATLLGISAHEEYEARQGRAKLIPGIAAAKKVSKALDEYHSEYENYPGKEALEALALGQETVDYTLSIEENTGQITVEFDFPGTLGNGQTMTLEPPTENSSRWSCTSDIQNKFLPKSCH